MISTTRDAKQPLILTIVYGRNESSRRNYSRRATNSDEMIMIIGCHKFPFLLDPSPLLGSRPPLVAPRCHLCDRTLRIDLANFYNCRCRWPDSPFRNEEDFYLAKLLSFVESLITAFSSFATCRAANRPIK